MSAVTCLEVIKSCVKNFRMWQLIGGFFLSPGTGNESNFFTYRLNETQRLLLGLKRGVVQMKE